RPSQGEWPTPGVSTAFEAVGPGGWPIGGRRHVAAMPYEGRAEPDGRGPLPGHAASVDDVSPGGRRSGSESRGAGRCRAVAAELVVRQRRSQDQVTAAPASATNCEYSLDSSMYRVISPRNRTSAPSAPRN